MQNNSEQNINVNSGSRDNWHFIVMAIIEGGIVAVNFIGMMFAALQIKSENLYLQIIPSLFIIIQVPLLPFLLGFSLYSLGFLFIHRKVDPKDPKKNMKSIRILIKVHVTFILYFMAMFIYWSVFAMSLPQPK